MSVTDIGITKPWNEASVSAGAEISAKGSVQLKDQRIVNDDFDSALDTGQWATSIAGGGAVTDRITSKRVRVSSDGSAAAAILIDKVIFDVLNTEESFGFVSDQQTSGFVYGMTLFNSIAQPTTMTDAALGADRVVQFISLSSTTFQLIYIDNVGTVHFYNGTTWTTSNVQIGANIGKVTFRNFDDSGTMKWQVSLYTIDGALQSTTPAIAWSATRAPAGGKSTWLFFGSPSTNLFATDVEIYNYERWANGTLDTYLTSAQDCEIDPVTFDEDFDSDEVTFKLSRTPQAATEIKGYVKEDAGAFGAAHNIDVTPIAGETGWFALAAGTTYSSHTTVTVKGEMNSPDTDTQLEIIEIKIKGITVAGGCGGVLRSNIFG